MKDRCKSSISVLIKRIAVCLSAMVISIGIFAGEERQTTTNTVWADSEESEQMKQNKESISDTEQKLSQLEQKQQELDEKINQTKDDISAEEENQQAIEEQISTVSETIMTLEISINQLGEEISQLEDSIDQKQIQIDNKKEQIEQGVEDFKKRIRTMYINGTDSYTDIIIGATDFYDMLMKIELVKRVAKHDDEMIDNLVDLKKQFEADEKALEEEKAVLEENKEQLQQQEDHHKEQKAKLDVLYEESQANLEMLAKNQQVYENNKEQIEEESDEFEKQLQQLYQEQEEIKKKEEEERIRKEQEEAERRRQQELARQQALQASANASASNAGGTTSGQSSLNNSDYNYVTKSQFTWPVPGYYHISYGIGWRWGSYHKGIDIWSSGIRGAKICAAASGTVILVSNTCTHDYAKNYSCGCGGGYGNYCIIDHGNGYWTLYGHSQKITVTKGQHVEQGDVLGVVGSTGHSTGDHLHFEIRLNGAVQDPTNYV